jgi:RimJ/RimL family protein N-acetyltransferase
MPHASTHTLETDRLRLTPFSRAEFDLCHTLFNDQTVCEFLWNDHPIRQARVREIHRESQQTFSSSGFGIWSIHRKQGETAGFVGLRFIGQTKRIELLYWLTPALWGHGFATEASYCLLEYAFTTLRLDIIEASTHPENKRSWALLCRIGMEQRNTEESPLGPLTVFALDKKSFLQRSEMRA